MIFKILKGTNSSSQNKLEEVLVTICENPNILWYPSAGNDFRDIIEAETRTEISPDLYFHTDYNKNIDLVLGTIFNDEATQVEILEINDLTFSEEVNYYVDPNFTDFPNDTYIKPKILLCDVLINYSGGQIRKPVIYFYFENINFLDEVLLRFSIPVSHIVKVREGMGFGGNKKSISLIYAFLSTLRTQFLLTDNSKSKPDFEVIQHIANKHQLELNNIKLINVAQRKNINDWSGYNVTVRKVEILNESFTDENFKNNLEIIQE